MARAQEAVHAQSPSPLTAAEVTARHVYAAYFAAQATVGVALWIAYAASPAARSGFDLPVRPVVTSAFAFPDLGVIVVGSVLSAWAIESRARWAVPITAFTAGSVLYPTLYLVGWVTMTNGSGWTTLAIMIPPALLTSWISYQVYRHDP